MPLFALDEIEESMSMSCIYNSGEINMMLKTGKITKRFSEFVLVRLSYSQSES